MRAEAKIKKEAGTATVDEFKRLARAITALEKRISPVIKQGRIIVSAGDLAGLPVFNQESIPTNPPYPARWNKPSTGWAYENLYSATRGRWEWVKLRKPAD